MPVTLPSLALAPARPTRPALSPGGRLWPTVRRVIRPGDAAPDCRTEWLLERWVRRHLGSASHEGRVARLATDLFAATRGLHRLDAKDLRLLRWAAWVHDVGRAVRDETHPADGADLLLADRTLPLTAAERRQLAYLTLYHRGKVPAPGEDAILDPADDHRRLMCVLALLRAADGLDNRALGRRDSRPPRVVFGLARQRNSVARLRVDCYLHEDSAKARRVYTRRKKYRLMEALMKCEVVPTVVAPVDGG